MQHLLGRARWDADAVRDDVCEYVLEHLHDEGAVLVVDETGDVKEASGRRVSGLADLHPWQGPAAPPGALFGKPVGWTRPSAS